jgi:hypothetical protein
VPPPPSSLTPGPKFRRGIYRSIKDINERPERALAAVLDRIKTSGELLRTASQVRELRSRNTRSFSLPARPEGDIQAIRAKGRCQAGGGACQVGVRIPDNFHGTATVIFGRAASPGERYATTGSAFAPGEALHGLRILGRTVAEVLAILRQHHVSAAGAPP